MPRYIDAEKLEKDGWSASRTYQQDAKTMVYETKKMTDFPTADVVERKVGEWECSDDILEYALCSCCKWDSGEAWEYALKRFRFCPNCGAEMKGQA